MKPIVAEFVHWRVKSVFDEPVKNVIAPDEIDDFEYWKDKPFSEYIERGMK